MKKTSISELSEFGQSIWLDNINRTLIESGKLKEMIGLGLRGLTSNPTIFEKAVLSSSDYDNRIAELCKEKKSSFDIYDDLTITDIQDAADLFKPVYEETNGLDGYVSLEINPKLAFDVRETVKEGKRLHKKVNRPNLMLKVPATNEGFAAVEELIACGMNVNTTLIFSLEQYVETAQAYIKGIKRLIDGGNDAGNVCSVASVFISRIDTAADKRLDEKKGLDNLKGKAAVANTALVYAKYLEIFSSDDFNLLKEKGANLQRVLWGSTSTKDPAYSDTKYVTELICKDSVNTLPPKTFDAFLDHGTVKETLTANCTEAQKTIDDLKAAGIDVNKICAKLLTDGIAAFEKSFDSLLNSIEEKARQVCLPAGRQDKA